MDIWYNLFQNLTVENTNHEEASWRLRDARNISAYDATVEMFWKSRNLKLIQVHIFYYEIARTYGVI